MNSKPKRLETALLVLPPASLLLASWFGWAPIDFTEACGFVTGAVCVWLVTRESIWNWPIGLANNLFFALLFWRVRLFADMGLQGVYLVLGIWGWWQWLRGGENRSRLKVTSGNRKEWIVIALFLIFATWGLREILIAVDGSAPFWDSLTTTICLSAQYLLCRKRIENWWLWIAADLIYVSLYFQKHLPLTAVLYVQLPVFHHAGAQRDAHVHVAVRRIHRPVRDWDFSLEKGNAHFISMNPQKKFGLGVVIGKFLPPHRGHHFLIDTALSRCTALVVIICEKPGDPVPGNLRQAWLQEMHPSADVRLIDDRYDEDDSSVWAENTIGWLGRAPDVVFTSERYGDAYAAHMNCRHIMVDHERQTVPCSATMVRSDPFAQWEHLSPPVRGWYAKRIVVLGAESTGTTTLAQTLAKHCKTTWVAEYGREYSFEKQTRGEIEWTTEEFLKIAIEQTRRENLAAREAHRSLICDTNAFATTLWHRRYMGFDSPELGEFAKHCRADLYLLTGDEIPFVQDGLRDGESIRHEMHRWFEVALANQSVDWLLLRGSPEARMSAAIRKCAQIAG